MLAPLAPLSFAAGVPLNASGLPSWLVAATTVNAVATIPGSKLGGSAGAPGSVAGDATSSAAKRINAFCGMAFDHARKRICLLAHGGHSDYQGNEVSRCDLNKNTAEWSLLKAIGSGYVAGAAYYSDNTPNARHTYYYNHWVPQHGAAGQWAMTRATYTSGAVNSFPYWDEFNPETNQWDVGVDAGGTWPNSQIGLCVFDETLGMGWGVSVGGTTLYRYDANTDTWVSKNFAGANYMYMPLAWSADRSELFFCANGDNYSFGNGVLTAAKLTGVTGATTGWTKTNITFNAGAGLTDFLANTHYTPGMVWDSANGCYWMYEGRQGATMQFYKITPNGTTVWDIELVTMTGTTIALSTGASAGGINSKLRYVPDWKGLILLADANSLVYYIRTASMT